MTFLFITFFFEVRGYLLHWISYLLYGATEHAVNIGSLFLFHAYFYKQQNLFCVFEDNFVNANIADTKKGYQRCRKSQRSNQSLITKLQTY
ncbi:hypothetical protein BD770DRAFT_379263 [Pilaira anomala]|nr:hypothetical protein BD770DRAFT_379263 [Pilaira anomala]